MRRWNRSERVRASASAINGPDDESILLLASAFETLLDPKSLDRERIAAVEFSRWLVPTVGSGKTQRNKVTAGEYGRTHGGQLVAVGGTGANSQPGSG